jgi:hypothetical protein
MLQYTMTTTGTLKALIILVVYLCAGELLLLKLDITVWFSTCVPFHNHYVPSFKSLNKVVLIVILIGYLKDFFMFTSYDNWICLGTYVCAQDALMEALLCFGSASCSIEDSNLGAPQEQEVSNGSLLVLGE